MSYPAAGEYETRLEWRARTQGTPDGFGQKPDQYAAPVSLWGVVEDRDATEETRLLADQPRRRAVVRVRDYPAVRPEDTLTDTQWAEVWTVDAVRRGRGELLIEVSEWA